jgi:uncharacterized protein YxjI
MPGALQRKGVPGQQPIMSEEDGVRYVIKQRAWTLRDSFSIRDESGKKVFRVKGRMVSVSDKLTLRSMAGEKLATIRQRVVSRIPRYRIRKGGKLLAQVRKRPLAVIKDRFKVNMKDGSPNLEIVGDLLDHEYRIRRQGKRVARVSKKWVSFTDSYGIQVDEGEDDILILACAIIVDMICHDEE